MCFNVKMETRNIICVFALLSICVFGNLVNVVDAQGYRCRTPDNHYGQCVILLYCPQLLNFYGSNRGSQLAYNYITQAHRSCGRISFNEQPVVCCRFPQYTGIIATRPPVIRKIPLTTSVRIDPITSLPPTTVKTTTTTIKPTMFTATNTPKKQQTTSWTTTELPSTNLEMHNNQCKSPDFTVGVCIDFTMCAEYVERLTKAPNNTEFHQFIRDSNKACNRVHWDVCCPNRNNSRQLLSPGEGCGISEKNINRVVGGVDAQKGQLPWIALLGYQDTFNNLEFKCGGSLITSKHIVTAAHCIKSCLKLARLGEHDLSKDNEAKHIDVLIDKVIRHPKYDPTDGHSDIGMVLLVEDVVFTDNIRPICIPTNNQSELNSLVGLNPYIAGWGKTSEGGNSSDVLQIAQIEIFENSFCQQRFNPDIKQISTKQFNEAIICAGASRQSIDSCKGDSGGPLILSKAIKGIPHFFLFGIVSYGFRGCARIGIPSVYSNVRYFIDWIKETVKDGAFKRITAC